MCFHVSSWVFMGLHGSSWVFMGLHGSSWAFMGLHVSSCVFFWIFCFFFAGPSSPKILKGMPSLIFLGAVQSQDFK